LEIIFLVLIIEGTETNKLIRIPKARVIKSTSANELSNFQVKKLMVIGTAF